MGESLGNIFGTKLPPDNCLPSTGPNNTNKYRGNTKKYKEVQKNKNIKNGDSSKSINNWESSDFKKCT